MSNLNRDELQADYVIRVLEDMDMDAVMELAHDYLHQQLDKLSMVELEAEVKNFYPDMIETTSEATKEET